MNSRKKRDRPKLQSKSPFFAVWGVPKGGLKLETRDLLARPESLRLVPSGPANAWAAIPLGDGLIPWTINDLRLDDAPTGPWIVLTKDDETWGPHANVAVAADYDPLQEHGLHRDFANLDTNEEAILRFASRRGFLGRRTLGLSDKPYDGPNGDSRHTWGEAVSDWVGAILRMRAMLDLWDLYTNKDTTDEGIRSFRERHPHPAVREIHARWQLRAQAHEVSRRNGAAALTTERRRVQVGQVLRELINEELAEGTFAAIDVKRPSPVLLVPRDLLGAMYTLFAREIVGTTRPPIACAYCGKYFDPNDSRRKFCSDACRAKNHRADKRNEPKNDDKAKDKHDG